MGDESGERVPVHAAAVARDAAPASSDWGRELHGLLGEFCHLVRNRLNSLQLCLYLAKRSASPGENGAWSEVERRYRAVERAVEEVQQVCRPLSLSRMTMDLGLLVQDRQADWRRWLGPRNLSLAIEAPGSPAIGSFDPTRMVQGLDALVIWRARVAPANSAVTLRWAGDGHSLGLTWSERWPLDAVPIEAASLSVAIVSQVMTAHGGGLHVEPGPPWVARMAWPSPEQGQTATRPSRST